MPNSGLVALKMNFIEVVVLLLFIGLTDGQECDLKYQFEGINHTACLPPSHDLVKLFNFTAEQRQKLLDTHNYYRKNEDATDMRAMYYDEELEMLAERWAATCPTGHDEYRFSPGRFGTGQNMWVSAGEDFNITAIVATWHSEKINLVYNGSFDEQGGSILSYTQVVYADSFLIGCAASECKSGIVFVCNYGPGMFNSEMTTPFTMGSKCGNCQEKCNAEGLCDCGTFYCKNSLDIDLNTCSCDCHDIGYNWLEQSTCEINCSKVLEPPECSAWLADDCYQFYSAHIQCPVKCGVCLAEETICGGLKCFNHGTIDVDTCSCYCLDNLQWLASTDCALNCSSVVEFGCHVWTPADCETNWAIPIYCPVMCGLCIAEDTVCGGEFCDNYGVLDADTCTCQCHRDLPWFDGPKCELNCSNVVEYGCDFWKYEDCTEYWNVPLSCPVKCGLCLAEDTVCSGHHCDNYGLLDEETCTCSCFGQSYWQEDSDCSINCTKVMEPFYCSAWQDEYCYQNYNVHFECPVKCGICTAEETVCGGLQCGKYGTVDPVTCTCMCYNNLTWLDTSYCTLNCSNVIDLYCDYWSEEDCERFWKVSIMCPVKCGLCQAEETVCQGNQCGNFGILDIETCTCQCYNSLPWLEESDCALNCSNVIEYGCDFLTIEDCKQFLTIPILCPVKCGLCVAEETICGGNHCKNYGTLDHESCSCSCISQLDWLEDSDCSVNCSNVYDVGCYGLNEDECFNNHDMWLWCPVQCGLCVAEETICGGQQCQNYGSLDQTTCECDCYHDFPWFEKPDCRVNCLSVQETMCSDLAVNGCDLYWNASLVCPITCGEC